MKDIKVLSMVVALLLSVAILASGCQSPATGEGDTIKIGAIMPMTGDISVYGDASVAAMKIAVEETNTAGGINGKQVELIIEDDQNTPEVAVNAFNKLVSQDKVDVVIGSITSKCTLPIAPLAQQAGIPLISTGATNEQVTEFGDFIFRVCYIDPLQGQVLAKFALEELKLTTAAIVFDNGNDYSKGLASSFAEAFTAGGGTITNDEAYSMVDQDFSAIIAKVKEKNPQLLFIPDYYAKNSLITKQVREAGLTDIMFLGADGWDSMVGNADVSAAGAYFTNHFDPSADIPTVQTFVEKYKAAKNGETPNALSALGYDSAMIMIDGIKRAGSTDRAAIKDAIAATDGIYVTGSIRYDEKRNPIKALTIIELYDDNGELAQRFHSIITP